MRAFVALLVVGVAFAEARQPLLAVALAATLAVSALALFEPLLRSDEALGELSPAGTATLDDWGVELHHDSVLADDALIPWEAVSAVVVDTGTGWGFAYDAGGKRRHLVDNAWSGLGPAHRPPLLAAGPVRPNVLLLLDPPAQ